MPIFKYTAKIYLLTLFNHLNKKRQLNSCLCNYFFQSILVVLNDQLLIVLISLCLNINSVRTLSHCADIK